MTRTIVATLALVAAAGTHPANAALHVEWSGFAQLTSQQLSEREAMERAGVTFGVDRLRIGMDVSDGAAFGRIHLDINRGDIAVAKNGTLPEIVRDAAAGYTATPWLRIEAGQFKAPLGTDFDTYGADLDLAKRAMEHPLVLDRTIGFMLSGRKLSRAKLGYDLFVGNPAGRSAAHAQGVVGHDQSMVGRVHFDGIQDLHVEAAFAVDQNDTLQDYRVFDVGARYVRQDWTFEAEYVFGQNIKSLDGDEQSVWYAHVGYLWQPDFEVVLRHYQGRRDDGSVSSELGNTWLGFNYFLGSDRLNGRVQVNYVFVSGDSENATLVGAGKGVGVFVDDAVLAQYQMHF